MFVRIIQWFNHDQKNKMKSLQAQVRLKPKNQDNPDFFHSKGSATVEAALVFPFFLCAICTVIVIAQFLLVEAAVYHATTQTAQVYAKQESCSLLRKNKTIEASPDSLAKLGGFVASNVIFHAYMEKESAPTAYVLGGREGILLSEERKQEYVKLDANYMLRVPVPFFQNIVIPRKLTVQRRLFTGYVPHAENLKNSSGQGTVYVTQYGQVYHTSLDCYHISLQISDPKQIQEIMNSSHYRTCEKCIGSGTLPTVLYVTKQGDCYHSTLECSGLKRTVTEVNLDDVSNMRICSECGKKH